MKKYTYTYEVIYTTKHYVDVEANDGDEADTLLNAELGKIQSGGCTGERHRKFYKPEITLVERSGNDNDFGDDH